MHEDFELINKFNIDNDRLYQEWKAVATKHRLFNRASTYLLMLINYPTSHNKDIDIVDFINQTGVEKFFTLSSEFKAENIVKDFQKTYTQEVVFEITDYITKKFIDYRPSVIKYAAQAPNSQMRIHTDQHPNSLLPRLLLSVNAPKGSYMQVKDFLHPLNFNGTLFKLNRKVPHNPINTSDRYRLLIHFDLEQI